MIDDGVPAHPVTEENTGRSASHVVTLRDYFAAAALPSAYARSLAQEDEDRWWLAALEAYNMADAMLLEREK